MNASQIYVVVSIVVLGIVALLVFLVRRGQKENRLTPLAGLAFGFILAGLFFGDDRLIGYGLSGIGVVLALIDIYRKIKST